MGRDEQVALNTQEMELVKRVAKRDGISEEEATTQLLQAGLARRVRKRTGKGPGRVYGFKTKR